MMKQKDTRERCKVCWKESYQNVLLSRRFMF